LRSLFTLSYTFFDAPAAALGYNQNLWDNDAITAASDQYWSGLTAAQQQAAIVLGWNKDAWDSSELSRTVA